MAGYIGSKAVVVSSGAERKKSFAITTTTTILTGLSYTPNQVHVFHNGVRLVEGTDFTAANGTSLTLNSAAQSGDEVVVVSYATFQVADTVSKSAGGTFDNDLGVTGSLTVGGNVLLGTTANPTNARLIADAGENAVAASFYASNATYGVTSTWNFGGTRIGEIGSHGSIDGGKPLTDFAINAPFNLSLTTGYTQRLRVDSVGRVTTPYQPAFYATGSNGNIAYTSGQTFPFNIAHFNVGNHYNASNGFFTAPISGVYSFSYNVFATTGLFQATVKINGTDWIINPADTQGIADVATAEGSRTGGITLVIPLATGDYVHIGMRNGFSGSVYMGHSHFCGYLLG
jgi:hypothetical protein